MEPKTLVIVCIHYNNQKEVTSYAFNSLSLAGNNVVKVIIVDNSQNINKEILLKKMPVSLASLVFIYKPESNMGYYGGISWGLKKYLEKHKTPDWVIASNTDILYNDLNFFKDLEKFHGVQKTPVVTPMIISKISGCAHIQHTLRRPTKKQVHLYNWLLSRKLTLVVYSLLSFFKSYLNQVWQSFISKNNSASSFGTESFQVYAPAGSYTILNKTYFDAGGNLDHGAFLYGEEIFVAESARRLGLKIIYDPKLKVIHTGYSTTNIFKNPQVMKWKSQAVQYYTKAFFS